MLLSTPSAVLHRWLHNRFLSPHSNNVLFKYLFLTKYVCPISRYERFIFVSELSIFNAVVNCLIVNDDQQDATIFDLFIYSQSVLHVSGDIFTHNQEHMSVFKASDHVHRYWCWLVSRMRWNFHLIRDTSQQQYRWTKSDAINTVTFSWWWAETSPKTYRADWE